MPKIQLRHDTSTNWTTYNPILLEGECGVETDTNKFKFGDGVKTWSQLDYAGETNLSNYYNKTEVNGLLDEKQNLLTPSEPLTITSYSKNNAVNMTSEDGKIWTENPNTYVTWITNRDEGNDLATFNDSNMGYIDIPYTIGQVVKLPVPAYTTDGPYGYAVTSGGWTTAFGGYYDENQNFCPVFHIHPPSSYSWYDTYFYLHPKNEMRYSSRGYEFVDRTTANSGDAYTKDTSPELGIAYFQMKEVNGIYTFCEESNTSKDGTSTIYKRKWTYTGADTLMLEVLSKVCAIRIYPGQFSGGNFGSSYDPKYFMDTQAISKATGFDVTSFGLYEANDTLDNIALTSLTNNLFDLGGSTTLTYLDLSIGAGLAVQSGNLVNTNATPYSLPTATTSTLGGVKVDGTTITINGNGVISSSGGGSSYTAGTGIDITNDIISIDNTVVATQTDLDEKQNVLTPDSPIYITSIVRPSNSGMTINSETNRAYSTNQIQMDVLGDAQALCAYLSFTSQDFGYINEHFWDNGYIEIPYSLGQVVCGGSGIEGVIGANLDNFPNLIFGKYVGTNFVPIALYSNNQFYIYYSDTYTFITGGLTTSGTSYLMSLGSDYYGDVPSTRTRISSPEYSRPYGNVGQIYFDPNNSTVTLSFGSNMYLRSETFSNPTVISRLNEVTTVRILPVWDSGNKSTTPLSTLNLGLYNFSTQITTTDLITENSLGTNLFDLQGETAQNYLGINIGSGLTISNGNLVNTNPTPADLSNYYTKTEIDNMIGNIETTLHNINSGV